MAKPAPSSLRRRGRGDAPVVRRNTIRLSAEVSRRIRLGHPWVYREALGARVLTADPGTVIELVDDEGEFVGRGLYEGDGAVAVRVFTRRADRAIDGGMVHERVRAAIALRRKLLDWNAIENLRLVNGESDGLPGVVAERYGNFVVVQLFSPTLRTSNPKAPSLNGAAESGGGLRDALYDALVAELSPQAIYEQRRYRPLAGEAPRQAAAELVRGQAAPVELSVREDDLTFWVDVTSPLSTGLFADLREGRRAVRQWAKGRRVLNLFSYTGAISVYAQAGGATEVCAVDIAAKAHARARKNFAASGFDAEKPEHIVGDAFKVLAKFKERGRRFDMVVIDPPAFASAAARGGKPWSALRDYSELVAACLQVTEPGGIFVAASSTHKITAPEFELALAEGAELAATPLQILDCRSLPVDFPTIPGFPEANYLKFVVAIRG